MIDNRRTTRITEWQVKCVRSVGSLFVGWLLNVPATCECISGADLLRQFNVLPHWDRSCRPKTFHLTQLEVCWLLNVPATCECISGTDLLRQLYVLPHWDRSYRPNFSSHPVTVYWHRADKSQHWPYNAMQDPGRVATGVPFLKLLVWLDPGKISA